MNQAATPHDAPPTPSPDDSLAGDDTLDPRRWWALVVCCSALFMTLLDVSVTNVALPSISADIGAGPSQLGWIVSGYTLSFGLVPVLGGRLGDDYGRRVMFVLGVGSFAVTSAVVGLAPSAGWLIAARVAQGVAGGLINPQVAGLIQRNFGPAERGRAFGFLGTTVGLGTALGPLIGGALIGVASPELGWRLVFFVNVPLGLVVIALAYRLLPPDAPREPKDSHHRLDVLGAVILGGSLFCLLFACVQYDAVRNPALVLLVLPAAGLGWTFWRREIKLTAQSADPLVDVRLFANRSFVSGLALALTFFPALAGIPLVLALFYQDGLDLTPLQSGLGVTAYAVGSALSASLAGRFVTQVGRSLIVAAVATMGAGAGAVALVANLAAPQAQSTDVLLLMMGPLFVMGLGSGAVITPNQTLSLMDIDPAMGSTAAGVLQSAQRVGLAVGQALVGAVFFAALAGGAGGKDDYITALSAAVATAGGFLVLSFFVGLRDVRRSVNRDADA